MKLEILSHPLSFKGMALASAVIASLSLGEARAKTADLDGDGIANLIDPDVDGDGIPNGRDRNADGGVCQLGPLKGKYVGDHLSNDDPNEKDIDADGLKDNSLAELDIDGDGRKDDAAKEKDIDGDGRADDADSDIDGDGLGNGDWNEDDIDGDGVSDQLDDDCDGDGKDRDHDDDDDGDGISDDADGDDDGNTIPDNFEIGDDSTSTIGGSGAIAMTWEPPQIMGPGAFPNDAGTINVGLGSLEVMTSSSALSMVNTFAIRSSILELVARLESFPDAYRGFDPHILNSGWAIDYREDPAIVIDESQTALDSSRRSPDQTREGLGGRPPVLADETVPVP